MKTKTEQIAKQWVTITAAAHFLGVSQDTLRRWEKKGALIPRRTVGGHRRYSRKQLERLLRQPMSPFLEKVEQKTSFAKKVNQLQVPPQTAISRDDIQKSTKVYVKDSIVSNIIKGNILTIVIILLVVSLLTASFILLQITKSQSEFLIPVPSYRIFQLP